MNTRTKRGKFMGMLAFLLAATVVSQAQLRTVPEAAEKFLETKYGGPESVEWIDNLTHFNAIFTYEGKLHKSKFTNKGKWLQTETAVEDSAVPAAVKTGLEKSRYADRDILQWAQLETASEEGIQYRVLVARNDIEKKYLYFNTEGRLLKEAITL